MLRRDRQSVNSGRLEQKSLLLNIDLLNKSNLHNTVLLEQIGLLINRDILTESGPHIIVVLLDRSPRQIHFLVPDLQDLVEGRTPPTGPRRLISQTLVHIIREFTLDLCREHVTLCTYCICTLFIESVRFFEVLGRFLAVFDLVCMNGPEAPGCFDSEAAGAIVLPLWLSQSIVLQPHCFCDI